MNINGGKPIGSGGFGCVFRPALKCSKSNTRKKNTVTKMLQKKHGIHEYNESVTFKRRLKSLPNILDYFLLPLELCSAKKLSSQDLIDFDNKCSSLTRKNNVNAKNINKHLSDFKLIQYMDGKTEVQTFIEQKLNENNFKRFNEKMILLLKKGIVPMNKRGVYHGDLKASNLTIDENYKIRIIDWGLSCVYEGSNKIPNLLMSGPLNYNSPLSNILLDPNTFTYFSNVVKKLLNENRYTKPFLKDEIWKYYEEKHLPMMGKGHESFLTDVYGDFLNYKRGFKESICEYCCEVIIHFIKYIKKGNDYVIDNKLLSYFKNVYMHNYDIWGFLMSYYDILEMKNNNIKNIQHKLEKVITETMFENITKPININYLVNKLSKINNDIEYHVIKRKTMRRKPKMLSYYKNSKTRKIKN